MNKTVYYLTGMGGRLHTGLGQGLLSRGCKIAGRELVDEFKMLDFQQRVELVISDLKTNFWHEEARVIANSFGAYLFLHAQSQIEPYIGKVILLSPVVGKFLNGDLEGNLTSPRPDKLLLLAKALNFPIPRQCEIYVGANDWRCDPTIVKEFGSMLGIDVKVVPNAGHMLPKEYVGGLLDKWLA
jgi:hypothetical protein